MEDKRLEIVLTRLLNERLINFNVPEEVRSGLLNDILAAVSAPEKKPHGACVMTAAASMAADRQIAKNKVKGGPKPEII